MDNRAEQLALEKLRALFNAEGIEFNDSVAALDCIAGTVLPTKLTKIYLTELERLNETIRPTKTNRLHQTSRGARL